MASPSVWLPVTVGSRAACSCLPPRTVLDVHLTAHLAPTYRAWSDCAPAVVACCRELTSFMRSGLNASVETTPCSSLTFAGGEMSLVWVQFVPSCAVLVIILREDSWIQILHLLSVSLLKLAQAHSSLRRGFSSSACDHRSLETWCCRTLSSSPLNTRSLPHHDSDISSPRPRGRPHSGDGRDRQGLGEPCVYMALSVPAADPSRQDREMVSLSLDVTRSMAYT